MKMSESEQPVWRVAIKDSEHPLHKATWTLFSERMNLKAAAKRLEPQKDEVIQYAITIIQDRELQFISALGSGYAPIHAVDLLGYWRASEAIPYILDLMVPEENEEPEILIDKSIFALGNMGTAAIEPVMVFAERYPSEYMACCEILSHAGSGNADVYNYLKARFENIDRNADWLDFDFLSGCLLRCNKSAAMTYLKDKLRTGRFSRDAKDVIKQNMQSADEGLFDERDLYDY